MPTVVVRYRPRDDRADENQRLVEAVFAELAATTPAGLSYTTLRLADGTFVHISETPDGPNPLTALAAFAAFTAGIDERCQPGEGPNPQAAVVVGRYRSGLGEPHEPHERREPREPDEAGPPDQG